MKLLQEKPEPEDKTPSLRSLKHKKAGQRFAKNRKLYIWLIILPSFLGSDFANFNYNQLKLSIVRKKTITLLEK